MSKLINSPASHVIITIHWNVGNEPIVKVVVTVWCSEPLVKAMFQRQVMWQVTQMPAITSIHQLLIYQTLASNNNTVSSFLTQRNSKNIGKTFMLTLQFCIHFLWLGGVVS